MISSLLWILLKGVLYLLATFLIYLGYIGFYIPLRTRRRFAGYKNVHISERFIPLLGDAGPYLDDMNNNRANYDHMRRVEHQMEPEIDLKLEQLGTTPILIVVSHRALKEFVEKTPGKIDRLDIDRLSSHRSGFLKAASGCFVNSPSTKRGMDRRKNLSKMLSLSSASKHITLILR